MCIICFIWTQHIHIFCYSCYFWNQTGCCLLSFISVWKQTILKIFITDFVAQLKIHASLQPRLQYYKVTIFILVSPVSCILYLLDHFHVSLFSDSLCLLQLHHIYFISICFHFHLLHGPPPENTNGHDETLRSLLFFSFLYNLKN